MHRDSDKRTIWQLAGISLVALVPLIWAAPPSETLHSIGLLHRAVLEAMHGEPRRDAIATPVLCSVHQAIPKLQSTQEAGEHYLFGQGECRREYVPDLRSLFSPMSDRGEIRQFFYDPQQYEALEKNLHSLVEFLERTSLSPLNKLDLQQTLWEFVSAVQWRRNIRVEFDPPIDQDRVEALLSPAVRALGLVLLDPEELKALPGGLEEFASLSGFPEIETLADRIRGGDETIFEDMFPTQLHNDFAQGRLFGRVFLTIDDPKDLARWREHLVQRPNTGLAGFSWAPFLGPQDPELSIGPKLDVRDLPIHYKGVHTILILYLNALTSGYRVVPTHMVAGWREVVFLERVPEKNPMPAADRVVEFRVVNYQKGLGFRAEAADVAATYVLAPEGGISRSVFLDVNPVHPGANVTTMRAQCLSCHANRVRAFDFRQRKIGFTSPYYFEQPNYPRLVEQKAAEAFARWSREYEAAGQGEEANTTERVGRPSE